MPRRARRHALLTRTAATCMLVAALLSGCTTRQEANQSGGPTASNATASNATASNATTQAGGTVTWAKPVEATALDPTTALLGPSWELHHLVYDSLVGLDEQLNVVPSLATEWEVTSPTEYVFTLRPGVKFSNGRELAASDVVDTFKRYLDPSLNTFQSSLIGADTRVEQVDEQRVRFILGQPNSDFLQQLTASFMSILPMKEVLAEGIDLSREMLGTGSFQLKSHLQNQEWVFERNPHAWEPPIIDEMRVKIIPDDSARIAALNAGSVDVATFDLPDAGTLLQGNDNIQTVVQNRTDYYILQLNAISHPAFKDVRVRQAIAYGLDRDKIKSGALANLGDPTAAASAAFKLCDLESMTGYKRDVAKAKQLLAEAGQSTLSFEIIYPGETFGRIAQVVKENLAEIGVTVKLSNLDEGVLYKKAWQSNPSEMDATIVWYAGYGGPTMVMNWWKPAGFNAGFQIDDSNLNETISAAQQATDDNKKNAVHAACEAIAAQANQIPLVTKPVTVAFRSDTLNASFHQIDGVINPMAEVASFTKVGQ